MMQSSIRSSSQSLSRGRVGGLRGELGEPLGASLAASAHVAILGGGITGLSAAWHLQQAAAREGRDGLPIMYTLIEQSDRWGARCARR